VPVEPPGTSWVFPDAERATQDLLTYGADLEPGTLLAGYRQGIFPMPLSEDGTIGWFSPVERAVLPIGGLRVTRSMRQAAKRFTVTVDEAFGHVVSGCADPRRAGSWISEPVAQAYVHLHELGWAHSVEVWRDGDLAGGLYGVAVGGLFCGESMFHRQRDASKVALMALVAILGYDGEPARLLDVQWSTPHLQTLGAVTVGRAAYRRLLARALPLPLPPIWR